MAQGLFGDFRHIALGEVISTNAECIEYARKSDAGNLWITAERQINGKGSRGRSWVSDKGNLYASLLLKDAGQAKWMHTLTFVASLAIRDAIFALDGAAHCDIKLKWPNDVLLNGKKTSGILLESHKIDGSQYVIIGIGVNIEHFPKETLYPATNLNAEGFDTTPQTFVQLLSHAMAERLGQWKQGRGFDKTRNDWLAASAKLDELIEVKLPIKGDRETLTGTFRGIDEQGLLLIEGAAGKMERISVADIFFA